MHWGSILFQKWCLLWSNCQLRRLFGVLLPNYLHYHHLRLHFLWRFLLLLLLLIRRLVPAWASYGVFRLVPVPDERGEWQQAQLSSVEFLCLSLRPKRLFFFLLRSDCSFFSFLFQNYFIRIHEFRPWIRKRAQTIVSCDVRWESLEVLGRCNVCWQYRFEQFLVAVVRHFVLSCVFVSFDIVMVSALWVFWNL